ncbi:MAG: hypothetical protein IT336_01045 [Thermomicrobiales bacterium]|nr:hypothetical protein [Thermomicrobiales bacterium]
MSGMTELPGLGPDAVFSQPPEWMLDCQFVEENAAGLALGALDPDETMRVTLHLSWCPNCAKLVHEMRKTVGYLPFTSEQAAPSLRAKSRLFDRITASEHVPAASPATLLTIPASTIRVIDSPPVRLTPTLPASSQPAVRPAKKRLNWEMIVAPLAAVPLVFALAIVGGWALRTQDRLNDQVAQARDLESENADLSAQVSLLSSGVGDSLTRRFVFDAPDSAIGGNSASGTLVGIVNKPWASLSVWNLPTNTHGYQVIVETKQGESIPAGAFTVDADGSAKLELEIQRPLQDYRAVHITERPAAEMTTTNDSLDADDVLWIDMESNLGQPGGTEANAKAH